MNDSAPERRDILSDGSLAVFFENLKALFSSMDEKYAQAAARCGFVCEGCDDNCCLTRFHHHTFLEFFHLKKAIGTLPGHLRKQAVEKAKEVIAAHAEADKNEEPVRIMCPLNFEGRCVVYEHRPMICRLHGIPSELKPPGMPGSARLIVMPGCDAFSRQCERMNCLPFDRTHFYMKLSALENEFKKRAGLARKIKMTVAQIVLCDPDDFSQPQGFTNIK